MTNNNFWEIELGKMFGNSAVIEDMRFVGRACIGRLSDNLNVKLRFVSLETHERYPAIEAAIINRNEGKIDTALFRFEDIWGNVAKKDRAPYVWIYNEKTDWYGYSPTFADYEKICGEVDDYLEIFQAPIQSMRQSQSM
jgi:hypothetical protein